MVGPGKRIFSTMISVRRGGVRPAGGRLLAWRWAGPVLLLGVVLVAFGCKPRFAPVTTVETYLFRERVVLSLAVESAEELELAATLATDELFQAFEDLYTKMFTLAARPDVGAYHITEVPMVCRSVCSGASVSPVSALLSRP